MERRMPDIAICENFIYLAHPGKAMGCSTNICLTVVEDVSDYLPQLCLRSSEAKGGGVPAFMAVAKNEKWRNFLA